MWCCSKHLNSRRRPLLKIQLLEWSPPLDFPRMVFQPHQPCQRTLSWTDAWSDIRFPFIHIHPSSLNISQPHLTLPYVAVACRSLMMSYHYVPLALTHRSFSMSVAVSLFTFPLSLPLPISQAWLKSAPNLKQYIKHLNTSYASSHRTKSHVSCGSRHNLTFNK